MKEKGNLIAEIPRRLGKVKDLGNIATFLDFRKPNYTILLFILIDNFVKGKVHQILDCNTLSGGYRPNLCNLVIICHRAESDNFIV